ncbi:MAG TPA: Hpt domain-containing protein, partial [Acidimicrobiales bacterium]|nr:Hpt domain-containing protein [Acidimicrobiales bacterium]
LEMFLEAVPQRLGELRLAADTGDARTIGRIAHTLRSNAAELGCDELAAACRTVETQAADGRIGTPALDRLAAELEAAGTLLRIELAALTADG